MTSAVLDAGTAGLKAIWNPALLRQMADFGHRHYNPEESLLRMTPFSNIHFNPNATPKHMTRESLYYALVLLSLDEKSGHSRAYDLVERVLELQETGDPQNPLYGLWHYVMEEKVLDWPFPDLNWADFIAMRLLLIRRRLRADAPAGLKERIDQALQRAALCIRRRNVDLNYTNIAFKGTLVTLAVGELAGNRDLFAYGLKRLRWLHQSMIQSGTMAEYNSPPYCGVTLSVLMAMDELLLDGEARLLARQIQHSLWLYLARRFHGTTGELAGPHARTYGASLYERPGCLGPLFQRISRERFQYDTNPDKGDPFGPFGAVWACLLAPDVPQEALALFDQDKRHEDIRESMREYAEGSSLVITTHIEPAFSLGTVNFQDGWEQRQNLIAYWPGSPGPGFLKQHYLHDERPCCSGFFSADQKDGVVLASAFIGRHGDDHVSFKVDAVEASFLGQVIEIQPGGKPAELFRGMEPAGLEQQVLELNETLFLKLPSIWIAVSFLRHEGRYEDKPAAEKPEMRLDRSGFQLRFPHYQGSRRRLLWEKFSQTRTVWGLVMAAPQQNWKQWQQSIAQLEPEFCGDGRGLEILWHGRKLRMPEEVVDEPGLRAFYRQPD